MKPFRMVTAYVLQGQEDPWNNHSPKLKVEGRTKRADGNIGNLA